MQYITIHGNLVKDAELVTFGAKEQVKFTVACNEGKGEKKVTTYYDVLSFSTAVQPYLLKGKDVIAVGRLSVRTSQGKDGKTYVNLNLYADGVDLCGSRSEAPTAVAQQAPAKQYVGAPQQAQDALPF